ncbi:hypothetical protein CLF_102161 [Clonorchis sinensis]|uniref:Uncharacterized protein n=1 Tax=Clonorchis sinensis TaxID=79923 RepID=G7Y7E0_CLOSI|nr:hypothetical protein CLF_102161 [Clonorchis sinensis]
MKRPFMTRTEKSFLSLMQLQTSTAVAQTPRRTVIHSNWLVPGLHSHDPPTKGKLSVTLHPPDSLCRSPSHPDPAATELRIPSPIAAPLTTVTGLSVNRSISCHVHVFELVGPHDHCSLHFAKATYYYYFIGYFPLFMTLSSFRAIRTTRKPPVMLHSDCKRVIMPDVEDVTQRWVFLRNVDDILGKLVSSNVFSSIGLRNILTVHEQLFSLLCPRSRLPASEDQGIMGALQMQQATSKTNGNLGNQKKLISRACSTMKKKQAENRLFSAVLSTEAMEPSDNDKPSIVTKIRETGRVLVLQSEEGNGKRVLSSCDSVWTIGSVNAGGKIRVRLRPHRFRQDPQVLRRTDPRFVPCLTARWLYVARKWTVHTHSKMIRLGKATSANGHLKDRVLHFDKLEHAIQKVSQHAKWLTRELAIHTSYRCSMQQILEGDGYALNVVRSLVVDRVTNDLFAEFNNRPANVSSPYEETSSVRSLARKTYPPNQALMLSSRMVTKRLQDNCQARQTDQKPPDQRPINSPERTIFQPIMFVQLFAMIDVGSMRLIDKRRANIEADEHYCMNLRTEKTLAMWLVARGDDNTLRFLVERTMNIPKEIPVFMRNQAPEFTNRKRSRGSSELGALGQAERVFNAAMKVKQCLMFGSEARTRNASISRK